MLKNLIFLGEHLKNGQVAFVSLSSVRKPNPDSEQPVVLRKQIILPR